MTTVELQAKKAELVQSILNDVDNEEALAVLVNTLKKLIVKFPCQHSEEELLKSGREAIEAYKAGILIPHEEIQRK